MTRVLEKSVTVKAPLERVWRLWTTAEGVTRLGPPQAWIELKVGGAYEWLFMPDAPHGQRGAEGCRVLDWLPERMLAFSWNAPPTLPTLRALGPCTHVVVELEPAAQGVTLTLRHVIVGEGPDWDAYLAYFDRAWGLVLGNLVRVASEQQ